MTNKSSELLEVLAEADALDLTEAEVAFASSLPDVPAKDAMRLETALEYRRLHALRRLGSEDQPESGTLLERFLKFAPNRLAAKGKSGSLYAKIFGHATPYPWRVEIADLCHAGPAPNSGGGSDKSPL
jgi:hypothetical protein